MHDRSSESPHYSWKLLANAGKLNTGNQSGSPANKRSSIHERREVEFRLDCVAHPCDNHHWSRGLEFPEQVEGNTHASDDMLAQNLMNSLSGEDLALRRTDLGLTVLGLAMFRNYHYRTVIIKSSIIIMVFAIRTLSQHFLWYKFRDADLVDGVHW
ncbi:hypothetical protein FPQ18DRAFT_308471 [Pyronema domesticum]|nr:hypothetical protein FPQ18DRAFT_308471 [Pyronema domesticum]